MGKVRRPGIAALSFGLMALIACTGATDAALAKRKHKLVLPVRGPLITVASDAAPTTSAGGPIAQRVGEATCPPGTALVGGGYDQGEVDPAVLSPSQSVENSHRSGLSSWRVEAFAAGGGHPVTVFAYCRANVEPLTEVVSDVDIAASVPGTLGKQSTLTVPCPQGQQAVAGGWGSMLNSFLHVTDSARSAGGNAWELTVSNFLPQAAQAPVYAYCTPNAVLTARADELAIPEQTSGFRGPVRSVGGACPSIALATVKKRLGKKSKKQRRKLRKKPGRIVPTVPVGGGFRTSPGTYSGFSFSVNELLDASLGPSGWTVDLGHGGIKSAVTTETYCMR